jgi:uncharacterized protein YndB with AHSA1/START domain
MAGHEGELLKTGKAWKIRFERQFEQDQAQVWAAIVRPGAMSRWFDETHMPEPLTLGGVIRFVHKAAGIESRGKITALDAPRLIGWIWISDFGPPAAMSFEVLPEGPGSRLILRQQVSDPPVTARTMAGWHKCLDRLQAMLGEASQDEMSWKELFEEVYRPKVAQAGLSVAQAGAPEPATRS